MVIHSLASCRWDTGSQGQWAESLWRTASASPEETPTVPGPNQTAEKRPQSWLQTNIKSLNQTFYKETIQVLLLQAEEDVFRR